LVNARTIVYRRRDALPCVSMTRSISHHLLEKCVFGRNFPTQINQQQNMIRLLLAPFALLYGIAIYARNFMFDIGLIKSTSFSNAIICVGNLTVGGTGKTPHIEYIIRTLSPHFKVAMLSRGYKRKTSGFLMASNRSSATDIGDEPLQVFKKFPDITVAVDEKRVNGIKQLISRKPNLNAILLDDAFQHRHLKPGLSILLTDYSNPIYNDYLLPMGKLRDSFKERNRAQIVVVTKCPKDLSNSEQKEIITKLKLKDNQPVYFSTLTYGQPKPVFQDLEFDPSSLKATSCMALAGIANPTPFFNHVRKHFTLNNCITLPDHYQFTEKKIKAIFEKFSTKKGKPEYIITTEKDATRLQDFTQLPNSIKRVFLFIPIEVEFLNDKGNEFNYKINQYVKESTRNNGIYTE